MCPAPLERPAGRSRMQRVREKRRIRFGFEDIAGRLAAEKKGIDAVRQKMTSRQQNRVSRLLLFSSDGADRLYRHIGQILIEHQPRLLGCRLDDGRQSTGKVARRRKRRHQGDSGGAQGRGLRCPAGAGQREGMTGFPARGRSSIKPAFDAPGAPAGVLQQRQWEIARLDVAWF